MPWYKCFIRGENFPGGLIGKTEPIGFYVTRFVQAANTDEAEALTIHGLKTEAKLAPPFGCEPSRNAQVIFEEITELAAESVPQKQPGFVFFVMETDA